jgi:hypothetical protein
VPPSARAAGGLALVLELRWDFAAVFGEFEHDLFVQPNVHRAGSFVLPVFFRAPGAVELGCKLFACGEAAVELEKLGVTRRAWATAAADARSGRLRRDGPELVVNLAFLPLAPARACELGVRMRVSGSGQACGGAARRGGRGQWFSAGLRRRPEEVRDTSRGDRGFARSRGTGSKAQWVRALRRRPAIRRRHHPHKNSPRAQAFGLQAQGTRLASASRPAWALEKLSRRDDIGPAGTFAAPHQ